MGIFRGWQPFVIYGHLLATRSCPCSHTCPTQYEPMKSEPMPDIIKHNYCAVIAAGCVPLDGLCLTIILLEKMN